MAVFVVVPPAPLVSLAEAKAHLRVTNDDEDAVITSYCAAASAHIDGPFGVLRRAIATQTLEVRASTFSAIDRLPCGPVTAITAVKFIDATGVEQDADDAIYQVHDGRFGLSPSGRWPAVRGDAGGVRVRYTAGFAEVPVPIKQAALLLVGQWFRNRMAVNVGNIVNEMPNGVKTLLGPYKNWEF